MKPVITLFVVLISHLLAISQQAYDTIPVLFRGKLDGDRIRAQYSYSGSRFPAIKDPVSGKPVTGELTLHIFHSNQLMITGQLPHVKLKEVKELVKDSIAVLEVPEGGYPGKTPIPIFDSSGIVTFVNGITPQNAALFQFRVLENGVKQIVPWRDIKLFTQSYIQSYNADGSEAEYAAFLGVYAASFGNALTIEISTKKDQRIIATLSAVWINRAPAVLGTFTSADMPAFLRIFKQQWQHDIFWGLTAEERQAKDSLLKPRHDFRSTENSLIFYLDDKVKSKDIIEYNLVTGKKQEGWKKNDFDQNLIWLKELDPGEYTLQMRYSIQRQNVSEYHFTIGVAWYQTILFKIVTLVLLAAIPFVVVLLYKLSKQRRALQIEQLQKQLKQTELKTIRAQLNPHFVFNALGSIQGLITKNDMTGADHYLTEFSMLMRKTLHESMRENVPVSAELNLLESYIKLEQLRFGFAYILQAEKTIDLHAIEMPSLLLQPLVENAIKHGISSRYEKGELIIQIKKEFSDLIIIIKDNGKGMKDGTKEGGQGLKLTRDRIELVNATLTNQSILLIINSSDTGTQVHLQFKNWMI